MRDLFHLQTDPPAGGGEAPTPTSPADAQAPPFVSEEQGGSPPPPPPLAPDNPSESPVQREARQDAELEALRAQTGREEGEQLPATAAEATAAASSVEPSGLPAEPLATPAAPDPETGDATALPEETPQQAVSEVPVGPTGEVAPADAARQSALESLRETATVFAQKCQDAIDSGVSVMEVLGIASGAIQSVQR